MKKTLFIALVLAMALAMAGCVFSLPGFQAPQGIVVAWASPTPTLTPTPTPPPPPPPPAPSPTPAGQQILLGVLDPCCRPNDNWPVVLEIRQGLLFATEFRGEKSFEEYLAGAGIGPSVIRIIAANGAWRHQNGYWDPILTVYFVDSNGPEVLEFNTRHMFGR